LRELYDVGDYATVASWHSFFTLGTVIFLVSSKCFVTKLLPNGLWHVNLSEDSLHAVIQLICWTYCTWSVQVIGADSNQLCKITILVTQISSMYMQIILVGQRFNFYIRL